MEQRLTHILTLALRHHVTDIHFNIRREESCQIEMRVNGVMKRIHEKPEDIRFFHYLMYRANLDLSASLEPQTGRFETEVNHTTLALRFAVVSSYGMTSGVLRILNNHGELNTSLLSTDPSQAVWFQEICLHRSGLYVFSGPTGSGKTTTLYTILNEVEGKKIFTLEDPIEVLNEKYVQLAVNDRQNLSYADGIKQLMRHDPDIVMIGEIRDSIAAEMAVRCALTGHLVVTSLHSGSCTAAIARLEDLGVSPLQLSDILAGMSNQRLYDTTNGAKIGVYEIMNRKEVTYYLTHHETSSEFIPLSTRIKTAMELGQIDPSQAAQDLD
ncbi:MAG: Flp pilus assembly complex ATPase component TadA [Solobacterium sp.]|nr:Flp pilus assembly complex ATPase component TadA [Solobacterium sp.]